MVDIQVDEDDPVGGVATRLSSDREADFIWKSLTDIPGLSGMDVGYGIVVAGSVISYCGMLFKETGSIVLEGRLVCSCRSDIGCRECSSELFELEYRSNNSIRSFIG